MGAWKIIKSLEKIFDRSETQSTEHGNYHAAINASS